MHIEWIKNCLEIDGFDSSCDKIEIRKDNLKALIRYMAEEIHFDEECYLSEYPDVRKAVENGEFSSGREHFLNFGFFEGRFPGFNGFDPKAYIAANPDLAIYTSSDKMYELAKEHYKSRGFRENRPLS